MARYFGTYADFSTASKEDAAVLLGADNMVGDVYDVAVEFDGDVTKAWLTSRFGDRVGYFAPDVSRRINVAKADGLVCKAVLSFTAFTNSPDEGRYWGNAAVVCYPPAYEEAFSRFIGALSASIADDVRPRVDFDNEGVDKIIDSDGAWKPTQTVPLPAQEKGTAVLKRRRSVTDKLIEQGRSRNKGCYVASWIVLLAVVALIVFALKSCFGW